MPTNLKLQELRDNEDYRKRREDYVSYKIKLKKFGINLYEFNCDEMEWPCRLPENIKKDYQ